MRYQVSLPPQVTDVTVVELQGSRQVEGIGVVRLITEGTDIRCDCAAPSRVASPRAITDTYPLRAWTTGIATLPNESQLNLFTVLGQVDSRGALTLTHQIEFTFSYTQPATGVTLGALAVNNNAPIRTDTASVPVRFSITADRARPLLLAYALTGPDGMTVAADSSILAANAGSEDFTLTLDARGWPTGPLNLHVTASDGETDAAAVLDRRGAALRVIGLGLEATLAPVRIEQGHAGELTLTAWDERGAPVDGLENRFAVSVDQLPATLNLERVSPGSYRALLPTDALNGGSHALNIRATDARGLSAQAEVAFGVGVPLRVRAYLPLLLRQASP
jgi:hypothetical protein